MASVQQSEAHRARRREAQQQRSDKTWLGAFIPLRALFFGDVPDAATLPFPMTLLCVATYSVAVAAALALLLFGFRSQADLTIAAETSTIEVKQCYVHIRCPAEPSKFLASTPRRISTSTSNGRTVIDGSATTGCRVGICLDPRTADLKVELDSAILNLDGMGSINATVSTTRPTVAYGVSVVTQNIVGSTNAAKVIVGPSHFDSLHVNLTEGLLHLSRTTAAAGQIVVGTGAVVLDDTFTAPFDIRGTVLDQNYCLSPSLTSHAVGACEMRNVSFGNVTEVQEHCAVSATFSGGTGDTSHWDISASSLYVSDARKVPPSTGHVAQVLDDVNTSAFPGETRVAGPSMVKPTAALTTEDPLSGYGALSFAVRAQLAESSAWRALRARPYYVQVIDVATPGVGIAFKHTSSRLVLQLGPERVSYFSLWALAPLHRRFRATLTHYGCPSSDSRSYPRHFLTEPQLLTNVLTDDRPSEVALARNLHQYIPQEHQLRLATAIHTAVGDQNSVVAFETPAQEREQIGRSAWYSWKAYLLERDDANEPHIAELTWDAVAWCLVVIQYASAIMLTVAANIALWHFRDEILGSLLLIGRRAAQRHQVTGDVLCPYHYYLSLWAVVNYIVLWLVRAFFGGNNASVSAFLEDYFEPADEAAKTPSDLAGVATAQLTAMYMRWASLRYAPTELSTDDLNDAIDAAGGRRVLRQKFVVAGLKQRQAAKTSAVFDINAASALDNHFLVTREPSDWVLFDDIFIRASMGGGTCDKEQLMARLRQWDFAVERRWIPFIAGIRPRQFSPAGLLTPEYTAERIRHGERIFSGFPSFSYTLYSTRLTVTRWETFVKVATLAARTVGEGIVFLAVALGPAVLFAILNILYDGDHVKYGTTVDARGLHDFHVVATYWLGGSLSTPTVIAVWLLQAQLLLLLLEPLFVLGTFRSIGRYGAVSWYSRPLLYGRVLVTALSVAVYWLCLWLSVTQLFVAVVWWALGAIIAPNVMLVYASAGLTFVFAIYTAHSNMTSLREVAMNRLAVRVLDELLAMLRRTPVHEAFSRGGNALGLSSTGAVTTGMVIDAMSLDEQTRTAAIASIAAAFDVPDSLVHLFLALARRRPAAVADAVKATFHSLKLPADVVPLGTQLVNGALGLPVNAQELAMGFSQLASEHRELIEHNDESIVAFVGLVLKGEFDAASLTDLVTTVVLTELAKAFDIPRPHLRNLYEAAQRYHAGDQDGALGQVAEVLASSRSSFGADQHTARAVYDVILESCKLAARRPHHVLEALVDLTHASPITRHMDLFKLAAPIMTQCAAPFPVFSSAPGAAQRSGFGVTVAQEAFQLLELRFALSTEQWNTTRSLLSLISGDTGPLRGLSPHCVRPTLLADARRIFLANLPHLFDYCQNVLPRWSATCRGGAAGPNWLTETPPRPPLSVSKEDKELRPLAVWLAFNWDAMLAHLCLCPRAADPSSVPWDDLGRVLTIPFAGLELFTRTLHIAQQFLYRVVPEDAADLSAALAARCSAAASNTAAGAPADGEMARALGGEKDYREETRVFQAFDKAGTLALFVVDQLGVLPEWSGLEAYVRATAPLTDSDGRKVTTARPFDLPRFFFGEILAWVGAEGSDHAVSAPQARDHLPSIAKRFTQQQDDIGARVGQVLDLGYTLTTETRIYIRELRKTEIDFGIKQEAEREAAATIPDRPTLAPGSVPHETDAFLARARLVADDRLAVCNAAPVTVSWFEDQFPKERRSFTVAAESQNDSSYRNPSLAALQHERAKVEQQLDTTISKDLRLWLQGRAVVPSDASVATLGLNGPAVAELVAAADEVAKIHAARGPAQDSPLKDEIRTHALCLVRTMVKHRMVRARGVFVGAAGDGPESAGLQPEYLEAALTTLVDVYLDGDRNTAVSDSSALFDLSAAGVRAMISPASAAADVPGLGALETLMGLGATLSSGGMLSPSASDQLRGVLRTVTGSDAAEALLLELLWFCMERSGRCGALDAAPESPVKCVLEDSGEPMTVVQVRNALLAAAKADTMAAAGVKAATEEIGVHAFCRHAAQDLATNAVSKQSVEVTTPVGPATFLVEFLGEKYAFLQPKDELKLRVELRSLGPQLIAVMAARPSMTAAETARLQQLLSAVAPSSKAVIDRITARAHDGDDAGDRCSPITAWGNAARAVVRDIAVVAAALAGTKVTLETTGRTAVSDCSGDLCEHPPSSTSTLSSRSCECRVCPFALVDTQAAQVRYSGTKTSIVSSVDTTSRNSVSQLLTLAQWGSDVLGLVRDKSADGTVVKKRVQLPPVALNPFFACLDRAGEATHCDADECEMASYTLPKAAGDDSAASRPERTLFGVVFGVVEWYPNARTPAFWALATFLVRGSQTPPPVLDCLCSVFPMNRRAAASQLLCLSANDSARHVFAIAELTGASSDGLTRAWRALHPAPQTEPALFYLKALVTGNMTGLLAFHPSLLPRASGPLAVQTVPDTALRRRLISGCEAAGHSLGANHFWASPSAWERGDGSFIAGAFTNKMASGDELPRYKVMMELVLLLREASLFDKVGQFNPLLLKDEVALILGSLNLMRLDVTVSMWDFQLYYNMLNFRATTRASTDKPTTTSVEQFSEAESDSHRPSDGDFAARSPVAPSPDGGAGDFGPTEQSQRRTSPPPAWDMESLQQLAHRFKNDANAGKGDVSNIVTDGIVAVLMVAVRLVIERGRMNDSGAVRNALRLFMNAALHMVPDIGHSDEGSAKAGALVVKALQTIVTKTSAPKRSLLDFAVDLVNPDVGFNAATIDVSCVLAATLPLLSDRCTDTTKYNELFKGLKTVLSTCEELIAGVARGGQELKDVLTGVIALLQVFSKLSASTDQDKSITMTGSLKRAADAVKDEVAMFQSGTGVNFFVELLRRLVKSASTAAPSMNASTRTDAPPTVGQGAASLTLKTYGRLVSVIRLATGDISVVPDLMKGLGLNLDAARVKQITSVFKSMETMSGVVAGNAGRVVNMEDRLEVLSNQIFSELDLDNSGEITFDEFEACLRRVHLDISDAEARVWFAEIDRDGFGVIDREAFPRAMRMIRDRFTSRILEQLRLTRELIYAALLYSAVVLLLLLAFILIGAYGFSDGTVFTAVIAGALPALVAVLGVMKDPAHLHRVLDKVDSYAERFFALLNDDATAGATKPE